MNVREAEIDMELDKFVFVLCKIIAYYRKLACHLKDMYASHTYSMSVVDKTLIKIQYITIVDPTIWEQHTKRPLLFNLNATPSDLFNDTPSTLSPPSSIKFSSHVSCSFRISVYTGIFFFLCGLVRHYNFCRNGILTK